MNAILPPGATYFSDYINEETERFLVEKIDAQPWSNELRRRVQHYGYRYDYKARAVPRESYLGPMPQWLTALTDRLVKDGIFCANPDQVIINEYEAGQGIASHIDCVPCFAGTIVSLSLQSGCEMQFKSKVGMEKINKFLEPRSLVRLSGASRFDWMHGIPARKSDMLHNVRVARGRRISLTFRNIVVF